MSFLDPHSYDVLDLIHNKCGHGNKKMLIEAVKNKLITGVQLSDKHLRKHKESDRHVCDVCARAKITRATFAKIHKIRGEDLAIISLWISLCL